jgi:hypothetical protein
VIDIAYIVALTVFGLAVGNIGRLLVPFWQKVRAGELKWSDFNYQYALQMLITFIVELPLSIGLVAPFAQSLVDVSPALLLVGGMAAGWGGQDGINELTKFVASFRQAAEAEVAAVKEAEQTASSAPAATQTPAAQLTSLKKKVKEA